MICDGEVADELVAVEHLEAGVVGDRLLDVGAHGVEVGAVVERGDDLEVERARAPGRRRCRG